MKKTFDPRGLRGVFSRGHAGYGVSGAPRTGNIQQIAKRRLMERRKRLNPGTVGKPK